MLDRDIINKMDVDELRNYLYHLQNCTITINQINSTKKTNEDTLIRLLGLQKDLSFLTLKVKDQENRLAKLTEEIEDKYLSKCSSHEWKDDDTF